MDDPVALSDQFLRAVRRDEPTDTARRDSGQCQDSPSAVSWPEQRELGRHGLRESRLAVEGIEGDLAALAPDGLAAALDGDGLRLAFWVNVYNAAVQRALDENPDQYEDRRTFFGKPLVTVAGESLSLDGIEHGILRRSYSRYTLGYVRSPFRDAFHDQQAVSERDPRVHFALNCGAESCPPVAAYSRDRVDDQLDLTTGGYLERTVEYDRAAGRVTVPRVMLWFRGDFGGKDGIYDFLRRYDQLPAGVRPSLSYHDWDWSLRLGKYADLEREESPQS